MQKNSPKDNIDFKNLLSELYLEFDGAWNLCFVNAEGKFFASRDPNGFHPLCYGIGEDFIIVSSESNVISNLHIEPYDLQPGTVLTIDPAKSGYTISPFSPETKNHCFFDSVSNPTF